MANTLIGRASQKLDHRSFAVTKSALQSARALFEPVARRQTVFIAAAQRSGTTMMLDVLDRSFDTEIIFEWDPRAYDNCELRRSQTLHPLINQSKAPNVVLKALCELQELRRLLDEYAPARAVWMLRDYRDVVNSHLALWTGMPESVSRIASDRDAAGWRGRGMSDETHALVRQLYRPGISNASSCALFWYFRNILFFEQALEADSRVMLVQYESLVTRPQTEFRRLFDFLGIAYTPRVSKHVFASSVKKRPEPEIDPPIARLCEGLTEKFAALTTKEE